MTEIPEHLLKRSRERRQALGLSSEGGEAGSDAPAASADAPATTTPAAAPAPAARATPPTPAAPPPPKPVPAYVQAAQRRRATRRAALVTVVCHPAERTEPLLAAW